jgi:hypothetical protein
MPSCGSGSLLVAHGVPFNGIKVFSATMVSQRETLGEIVTSWIAAHPQCKVTEFVITQSSDSQFHCVTVTILYAERVTSGARSIAT